MLNGVHEYMQGPVRGALSRPCVFDEATKTRVREMYAAGYSTTEIARRIADAPANVMRALQRMGVKLRTREEGKALSKARNQRLRSIAAAAQKVFGHLFAPRADSALPPVPVNEPFVEQPRFAHADNVLDVAFDDVNEWGWP
jgi:hypothetical protein